ncbi:SGNH/GDSL hydrolase family protein [Solwaraspora sp. WMMD791]|uniref:SGNH/GDSL hydrolase family protein n=1 Tax=Solwaraspora sp. WMMD791 TaxID=3016086 RepID=UPI00249C412F|nr:SGNH/GDSL hydrolase family protein [Solwaraspora sp. WMMD791]WFE28862.1 SGNH/GDSL hydrolase family protein [Solwaraspora sp. WMMD791]
MARRVPVAVVVAAVLLGTAVPTAAVAGPGGPDHRHGGLDRVHTAGRVVVDGATARYSWPGVYFEGRFRGSGIGIVLDDPHADYDVQIDGRTVATLVTPGAITHRVDGLRPGRHTVRVVKRSESQWATSTFGGFVPVPGGAVLPAPAPRHRQIEFIGDSHTAGYGNESTSRDCTGDEVHRTTNADRSFGAITARRYGADYQINGYSGLGMVRNYGGHSPGTTYRTYYDRALLAVDGDVWPQPRSWRPQVVVVGLGLNDFSTDIAPGESWTPETLGAAYREAYHGFLDQLRARYGDRTHIVVTANEMWNTTAFRDAVTQVVAERNDRGDDRVRMWYVESAGLDSLGCHWHPSVADHQLLADRLSAVLDELPLRW